MTNKEFSNEFDTLLNSYAGSNYFGIANGPFELDDYEKSVFLTQSQEKLVLDYYSGVNQKSISYEKTEEVRKYLDGLNKIYNTNHFTASITNSFFVTLPNDVWFITYESAGNKLVVPTTQDEFYKTNRNPFKQANDNRVLRLDYNNNTVELIATKQPENYFVKYISKPSPIIISDLPDNLSINGISKETECTLNPVLHRAILEQAVIMAFNSRIGNTRVENK